jgi:hypothetical protein
MLFENNVEKWGKKKLKIFAQLDRGGACRFQAESVVDPDAETLKKPKP